MNTVMMNTHPAKKRKMPYSKWHRMVKNACAMTKVKIKLVATVILWPADRVSRGKISLGTNHPRGPHDHAKAAT